VSGLEIIITGARMELKVSRHSDIALTSKDIDHINISYPFRGWDELDGALSLASP
jgi:hypothetical protein